jgi:peptide/nickel transport system permease protein
MYQLIGRRAISAVVLLFLASILCFLLVIAAPGNVAVLIAEQRSGTVTVEDVKRVEQELGLTDPLPIRYGRWLGSAVQGDLGPSLRTGEDILRGFAKRLPQTGKLLVGAGIVAIFVGLGLGYVGALRPGGFIDSAARAIGVFGVSVPTFFVGILLVLLFGVTLRWLPTFGQDSFKSWILPWITLGIFPGCLLSRVVRVSLEEIMARPFIVTAKSKGFAKRKVLVSDATPNLLPILITAFGTQFGILVFTAVVVEPLFSIQGVGYYFIEAAKFRDFTVVQACLLLFAAFFIVLNGVVDVIAMATDPKVRRL